jgi:hypothetical protein
MNSDKNDKIIYPYLNIYFNSKSNYINEFNLSKLLDKNKSKMSLIKEDFDTKLSKNYDFIKSSRFSNLYTITSTSFSINSIYENMNKLTGYKLHRDLFLQKKIKNYILDECFFQTNSINFNRRSNFNLVPLEEKKKKVNKRLGSFQPSITRNSVGKNNSYMKINNNDETPKHKKIIMRNSLKFRQKRVYSIDNSNIINKFHQNHLEGEKNQKNQKRRRRGSTNFRQFNNTSFFNYSNISNKNISLVQDENNIYLKKRSSKRTALKLIEDEEMSFYAKMKTIRNKNNYE